MSIQTPNRIGKFWELDETATFQPLLPVTINSVTDGGTQFNISITDPNAGADLSNYTYVIERSVNGGPFMQVLSENTGAIQTSFTDYVYSSINGTALIPSLGPLPFNLVPEDPAILSFFSPPSGSPIVTDATGTALVNMGAVDQDGHSVGVLRGTPITVLAGSFVVSTTIPKQPTFAYRISVINKYMRSAVSNVQSLMVPSAFVAQVLAAPTRTANVISLSWTDANTYAIGDAIEISRDLDGNGFQPIAEIIKSTGAMPTSYNDAFDQTMLAPGTYTYQLSAFSYLPRDNGVASTPQSIVVPALFSPLSMVSTAIATNQINLTWTDPNSGNRIIVERQIGPTDVFKKIADLPHGATTYSDIIVPVPGQTYTYRLTPISTIQVGPPSATVTLQGVAWATATPLAPVISSVVKYADIGITVSWTDANPLPTTAVIQRSVNGSAFATIASVPSQQASYNDILALNVGDKVVYRILATNPTSSSAASATGQIIIHSSLEAPTAVTPKVLNQTTLSLSWRSTNVGNRGVRVFRSIGGAAFGSAVATLPAGARNWIDSMPLTPLVPGQTYSYQIQDFDNIESGPLSTVGTIIIPIPAPINLQVTAVGGGFATITWTDNAAIFDFTEIDAAFGSGQPSKVGQVIPGVTTFTFPISGGAPGTPVAFTIREIRDAQIVFGDAVPLTAGDYSDPVLTSLLLTAPTSVSVSRVAPNTNRVSWSDANTQAQGFKIYLSSSYGGLSTPYTLKGTVSDASARSFDDTSTSGTGATFNYVVVAFGHGTDSPASTAGSLTTRLGKPVATVAQTARTQMTLTVTAPAGYSFVAGDQVKVNRSLNGGTSATLTTVTASFPVIYVDNAVTVGDTVSYTTQITSANEVSLVSNPATAVDQDAVFLPLGQANQVRIIGSRTAPTQTGVVAACSGGVVMVKTLAGNPLVTSQNDASLANSKSILSGDTSQFVVLTGTSAGTGNIVAIDGVNLGVNSVNSATKVFDAGDVNPGFVGNHPWATIELRHDPQFASAQYAEGATGALLGWSIVRERRGPVGTVNFTPYPETIALGTWTAAAGSASLDGVQPSALSLNPANPLSFYNVTRIESFGGDLLLFVYDQNSNATTPIRISRSTLQQTTLSKITGVIMDFVTDNDSVCYGILATGEIFSLDFSSSPVNPGLQMIGKAPFLSSQAAVFTKAAIELSAKSTLIVSISYLDASGADRTDIFTFVIPASVSASNQITIVNTFTIAEPVNSIASDGLRFFYANSSTTAKLFRFRI